MHRMVLTAFHKDLSILLETLHERKLDNSTNTKKACIKPDAPRFLRGKTEKALGTTLGKHPRLHCEHIEANLPIKLRKTRFQDGGRGWLGGAENKTEENRRSVGRTA